MTTGPTLPGFKILAKDLVKVTNDRTVPRVIVGGQLPSGAVDPDLASLTGRVTALEALEAPISRDAGGGDFILDWKGFLDGSGDPVMWAPRTRVFKHQGGFTALSAANINPTNTFMPNHVRCEMASINGTWWFYLDVSGTPTYTFADAIGAMPTNDTTKIEICTIRGGRAYGEKYPVRVVANDLPFVFDGKVIIERGASDNLDEVSFGQVRYYADGASHDSAPDADQFFLATVPNVGNAGSPETIYFVPSLWAESGDAADALVSVGMTNSTTDMPDDKAMIPLLTGVSGNFMTKRGLQLLGGVPGGNVPNQCLAGRDDVLNNFVLPSTVTLTDQAAQKVEITDPTALALGFKWAWQNTQIGALAGQVQYGFPVPDDAGRRNAFIRIFVVFDEDDFYIVPAMRMRTNFSSVGFNKVWLEKHWGDRCYSFIGWDIAPTEDKIIGLSVDYASNSLSVPNSADGHTIQTFGLQGHYGSGEESWVMRADYPLRADRTFICPPIINWIDEISMPFIPGGAVYERSPGLLPDASIQFALPDQTDAHVLPIPRNGSLIDTKLFKGNATYLQMPIDEQIGRRVSAKFQLKSTSAITALTGKNLIVHYSGDSTIDFSGRPSYFKLLALRYGAASVTLIGTLLNSNINGTYEDPAEGRSGKQARDYVCIDLTGILPIGVALYAEIYIAGDDLDRHNYNPYPRYALVSDPVDDCFFAKPTGTVWTTDGLVTVTMTSANPCVLTWTGSNMPVNAAFKLHTTGHFYTGVVAGTTYYVLPTGLGANSFRFSATPGGSAIATSGTQAGIHSIEVVPECATTGNIALAGEQTLDGVLTSGNIVLVWKQTDKTQNGLYVSAAGAWSRLSKMSSWEQFWGRVVQIRLGTLYADEMFMCLAWPNGVLGVDSVWWEQQPEFGWTYDFGFYLSRNSYPTPTHVFIALIINDLGNNAIPQGQEDVIKAWDIMLRKIHDFDSTIEVAFTLPALSSAEVGGATIQLKWNRAHAPAYVALLEWFTDTDDVHSHISPGFLFMDINAGWDYQPANFFVSPHAAMPQLYNVLGPVSYATGEDITLSGPQVIDGASRSAGTVLVKKKVNQEDNGIWNINPSGAWTRFANASTWDDMVNGVIAVTFGDRYAGSQWRFTIDPGGTLDTDPITLKWFGNLEQDTSALGFLHPQDPNVWPLVYGDVAIVANTI